MKKSSIKNIKPAFADARGSIFDVFDGEDIQHIGFITSKKGSVRGNHYHKRATQYTYLLKGKAKWVTRDMREKSAKTSSRILAPGCLAVDTPYVAHALVALSDAEFIFFTDRARFGKKGYEEDTFRVRLTGEIEFGA